jgi:hypothetical protein
MAILLIQLNGAPEDEILELRQLLHDNTIDFYETEAGRWGTSVAAIWLGDESQLEQARSLIDTYQEERAERIRREYEQRQASGDGETLLTRLLHHPLRSLLYLALIVVILYLTLMPFIGRW